jgi:hypothetical protein
MWKKQMMIFVWPISWALYLSRWPALADSFV